MKGAAPQSRPQAQSKSTQDYQASAGFCCDIFFSFNQSVFGPAWKPNSGEETNIRNAAARYWEANQFQDIPPGIALILAVGMYAVPRFNDEETQTRLRSIGEKLGIVKPKPVIVAESRVQSIPKPDSAFKPVDDEPPLQRNGYSTIYDRKPNG